MSLILNGTTATDVYLNGVKCGDVYLNGTRVIVGPIIASPTEGTTAGYPKYTVSSWSENYPTSVSHTVTFTNSSSYGSCGWSFNIGLANIPSFLFNGNACRMHISFDFVGVGSHYSDLYRDYFQMNVENGKFTNATYSPLGADENFYNPTDTPQAFALRFRQGWAGGNYMPNQRCQIEFDTILNSNTSFSVAVTRDTNRYSGSGTSVTLSNIVIKITPA